jgi:hypothetical protein
MKVWTSDYYPCLSIAVDLLETLLFCDQFVLDSVALVPVLFSNSFSFFCNYLWVCPPLLGLAQDLYLWCVL